MKPNKNSLPVRLAKLFSLFLITMAFLVLFVFSVFLPRTTSSDYDQLAERPKFSFGALLDGSYTTEMADYFSDTVFGRDRFKELYARVNSWFGKETVLKTEEGEDEIHFGNTPGPEDEKPDPPVTSDPSPVVSGESRTPGGESSSPSGETSGTGSEASGTGSETSSTGSETSSTGGESSNTGSEPPPIIDEELCDAGTILGTRALEVYYGDRGLAHIPDFAETLNNFAESLPGVNVYSMPIPKACAYYLQSSSTYGGQTGNSLRDLQAIAERLSGKVKNIDIYDVLKAHASEEIYFRTDHHWTALGAYYATQKLASDLQLPFQDLSAYEENVRPGYVGTMYKYSGYKQVLADNPENFVIYQPKVNYTATFYNQNFQNGFAHELFFHFSDDMRSSWYSSFLNGDAYAVQVQSGACSNGRKLLIVKDSYGNALAPFLLYSFEEIYVVDARVFQLKLKDFVAEQGITDVLFAESLFSAVGGSYIDQLRALCE